jgi:hypothetical protein
MQNLWVDIIPPVDELAQRRTSAKIIAGTLLCGPVNYYVAIKIVAASAIFLGLAPLPA